MKMFALAGLLLSLPIAALPSEATPADSAASAVESESPARAWLRLTGIDTTGWRLVGEQRTLLTWLRPDGIIATVDVLPRGADHDPYLYDLAQAQAYFRTDAERVHAGLVEVQVHRMMHGTYDLVTTRALLGDIAPQSHGSTAAAYTMVADFPMPTCIGEIRLFAVEGQPTGMREALVSSIRTIKENNGKMVPTPMHDPYDARFDATARYMDSDARRWDGVLPTHPLTRIRQLMPQLMLTSKLMDVPATVTADLAAASAAEAASAASR